MSTKPNKALSAELRSLARNAQNLQTSIDNHNYLPDDFPKENIRLLTSALVGLEHGSLRGCKVPLEHSLVRISEIRRNFFPADETLATDEDDPDAIPILERGDALDRAFSDLISAASTSLDAYREQARSGYDSTSDDDYLDIVKIDRSRISDTKQILNKSEELAVLSGELEKTQEASEPLVSDAIIEAYDTRNLTLSTTAEIQSRFQIRRWTLLLTKATKSSISTLRKTLSAIRTAKGILEPLYKRFKSSVDNVEELVLSEIDKWLETIDTALKKTQENIGDNVSETKIGVIRKVHGSEFVIDDDGRPFSIVPGEKLAKNFSTIVRFSPFHNNGIDFAANLKRVEDTIFYQGLFLDRSSGTRAIVDEVINIVKKRKHGIASIPQLERLFDRKGIAPHKFYRVLGYDSFSDLLTSIDDLYYFGIHEPIYVSLEPITPPRVTRSEYLNWAFDHLGTVPTPYPLGKLAIDSAKHFNSGLPMRVVLGFDKFGGIFEDDERFVLAQGSVSRQS